MNLNEYDPIEYNNNNRTWLDCNYHRLYSNAIPYRKYYALLTKYVKGKGNEYYIAMLDNVPPHIKANGTDIRKDGTIIIKLHKIWNTSSLRDIKENVSINLELKEQSDDGEVYFLDI